MSFVIVKRVFVGSSQQFYYERLLLDNLDGICTSFDGGAGYGRFSLLLAARGVHVTHFDISLPMIDKAKNLAEERGAAKNMTFVHGSLEDLSAFCDNQFDLAVPALCRALYPVRYYVISCMTKH